MVSKAAAVGSSSRAAVGFRVHSGWAAFVAVSLDGKQPRVLARGRPELVESFTYKFRQPYHTAESMALDPADAFISSVEKKATNLARNTIRSVQASLRNQGCELTACALIQGSGKPLPELEKILASHPLIHTADGELFRRSLMRASADCGLADFVIKEKALIDTGCEVLGLPATKLAQQIAALGKPIGPPWSQDEKFAALAAWLALRSDVQRGML